MTKHHSPLASIGEAVMDAAAKYGINPTYIVAHAVHETGWGTSKICREKNNLFGWNAIDPSPFASAGMFPSPAACIDFVMGRIKAPYLSTDGKYFRGAYLGDRQRGMNANYATDPQWGAKIAAFARQMESEMA